MKLVFSLAGKNPDQRCFLRKAEHSPNLSSPTAEMLGTSMLILHIHITRSSNCLRQIDFHILCFMKPSSIP